MPFVLRYAPSHLPDIEIADAQHSLASTERFWREWVDKGQRVATLVGCRDALADHVACADLRTNRRHRGGTDDFVARATGRRAQLGLSLLLAARRDADVARADGCRLLSTKRVRGASGCCARSPAARARCRSCMASPASAGLTEWEVPWLPGYEGSRRCASATAAHPPIAARRLRRSDGCASSGSRRRHRASRRRRGHCSASCSSTWRRSGSSRTTACGKCAGHRSISRTRRSWRGSRSTVASATRRPMDSSARSSVGGRFAPRSTRRSASAATTRSASASCRPTAAQELDASLLQIPELGFLPPDDPRVLGTIRAIESRLVRDGFVLRYDTKLKPKTACRRAKARSSRAASGWLTRMR